MTQGEEKGMNEAVRREEERRQGHMRWYDGRGQGKRKGGREGKQGQWRTNRSRANENKKHDADGDKDMFALRCYGQTRLRILYIYTEQSYFSVVFLIN